MLYRVVCLLALCASTQSLSLGPKYAARSHVARAGIARAGLETLTEEAALALEGGELEAVATELSVYLFKSPPFQEKAEQPKRRMLALVYEKLGIMGKAESCAREVRCPALPRTAPGVASPRQRRRGRRWAGVRCTCLRAQCAGVQAGPQPSPEP